MRAPRPRSADDRGETLIELLVAIVIMGLVFVVVLGGIGTAIVGAATQRTVTTLNTVLATAAGTLAAESYVPCGGAASYGLGTPPAGYTVSISAVAYWDGVDSFVAGCPSPDNGLQQLTLQVVGPGSGGGVTRTRVVVKRDAS